MVTDAFFGADVGVPLNLETNQPGAVSLQGGTEWVEQQHTFSTTKKHEQCKAQASSRDQYSNRTHRCSSCGKGFSVHVGLVATLKHMQTKNTKSRKLGHFYQQSASIIMSSMPLLYLFLQLAILSPTALFAITFLKISFSSQENRSNYKYTENLWNKTL